MAKKAAISKIDSKCNDYKSKSEYSDLEELPDGLYRPYTSPSNAFMLELLGQPRKKKDYSEDDKGLDNQELKNMQIEADVGPFTVTGLALAVQSLQIVMRDIKDSYPEIFARIGTTGMRCVRVQRGTKVISNHAWGCAVDLTIDRLLDPWRDNKTQHALVLISPIFNKHRWVWGGLYKPKKAKSGELLSREDAMHFEVSKEMLLEWAQLGYLGQSAQKVANKKQTIKVSRKNEYSRENRDGAGQHVSGLRTGVVKAAPNTAKPNRTSPVLKRPLPKRFGEPYHHWLGRTAITLAKSASSWFR